LSLGNGIGWINGERRVKRKAEENAIALDDLEGQIALVMDAIKRRPSMKGKILSRFLSNIFVAVKETLRRQGRLASFYMIVAEVADFGVPPLTEDAIALAKESKAEAIVVIEGFHSNNDISDVIYHVSMSAPSFGVLGWVLKVKIGDGTLEFVREWPYFFDTKEKVKTLGEILTEMEDA
jgi:hypothetical protein